MKTKKQISDININNLNRICEKALTYKRRFGIYTCLFLFDYEFNQWLNENNLALDQVPESVLTKVKAQDHMFVDYFSNEN